MRRRIGLFFAALLLMLGLVAVTAQPASAAISWPPVPGMPKTTQKFKVAPFSKSIKVSNGAYGWGSKRTVRPGKTANIYVMSVQIPPRCKLQWTQNGINFTNRNKSKTKYKWKSGIIMPYGTAHARIICP